MKTIADNPAVLRDLSSQFWHCALSPVIAFSLLFLISMCSPAVAQPAVEKPAPNLTPHRVAQNTYYVEGVSALGSTQNRNFISNAGFVVTSKGVVVIDALGSPALAAELIAEIAKVTPQPVTHVIVTHYHADHIYGLQEFKARGAKILAHRRALEYLNSDTARLRLEVSRKDLAPWVNENTRLVEADEWIDDQRELPVGDTRYTLIPAGPSHTPEDLIVYLPQHKVLFAGDLVFSRRIPFVGQADSKGWIAALDQLLQLDSAVIVPGHGPASASARDDLLLTREYLTHLRNVMKEAARNLDPWEDAYKKADWSKFDRLPLFQSANRINAYNTYLLLEKDPE